MTSYSDMYELRDMPEEKKNKYTSKATEQFNKRCNTTVGRMGTFLKHCKALRAVMKAASDEGFCLDELMQGVRELENNI